LPSLFQQRAFMRLWIARIFGTLGTQILMLAVGWQMYDLTGSAWDLGLVGLLQFLPALLLTLVAGHLADRLHRGRIVAVCVGLQALVALTLLWVTQEQWVSREWLLSISLVLGTARAFQMPAQQALTPLLVPPTLLPRAMSLSAAGMQGATIGGPALGGAIFLGGASAVYATGALLFAVSVVLLSRLHYDHVPPPREPMTLHSVLAGVRFIWEKKTILGAVSLDLFAVLLGGATALLPMFAKDILHTGPWGLGLLRASPAVGALLMSIALTRWPLQRKVGRTLLLSVGLYGLCMVIFGASTNLVLSMAVLAISGSADMVSVVVRQSLVQLETPNEMRGRVSAVNSVFIGASNQLGEFESGATAALLGPVGSVVAGGIGTLVVAVLWLRLFPSLARRDTLH
jgi:MFS family permease